MPVTVSFTRSGALAGLDADGLSLLQYPATEFEAGPANLWLRDGAGAHPLTGPASGSSVGDGAVQGTFGPWAYEAWFDAVGDGFCWQWRVTNTGDEPATCDVTLTLDVALTAHDDLRRNEHYVAQYLDLTPLDALGGTALSGTALGVRQNMPGSGNPWLAVASLTGTNGWATDALQVHDPTGELDLSASLPGWRWQHEHTLATLRSAPVDVAPGTSARGGFVGVFVATHPTATGAGDAASIEAYVDAGGWRPEPPITSGPPAVATVFAPRATFPARPVPLPDTWRGEPLTHRERGPDGADWSAFAGGAHLVTLAKERAVLRPHGHVLHAAPGPTADEGHVASTAWMAGVFASQLTRDHASAAPSLTVRRGYLGVTDAAGVRVAVRRDGAWHLLAQPSWWVQEQHACTWQYSADDASVTVEAAVSLQGVRLEVRCDPPLDVLVAVEEDHAGVDLTCDAGAFADDGPLFADGQPRGTRWRCLLAEGSMHLAVDLAFTGAAPDAPTAPPHAWRLPSLVSDAPGVAEVDATIAWLAHDAGVHFQAPRGLEQFTGGAWGTRDVCQGPVGLLLATGEHAALRDTLVRVFAGQHPDGDWPQWFDYLDAFAAPEARDSHGDIVYWPLLALGEYLLVTGDHTILDEPIRFVGASAFTEPAPVRVHVARALDRIATRRTLDPRLPAYGHGDWNDSLQPARPELAEHMCSAWTSVLEIEALRTLRDGLADPVLGAKLTELTARTEQALREVFLVDGELAGYALVEDDVELLVHPRDASTGLVHGSLQIIHALAGELLTPEEAAAHVRLIDDHLQGPHGVFLFSTPIAYHGGVLETFLRAEAATFWGREIGLMYTHAHLRWIEALTVLGDGERAWAELLRVVPVGLTARIEGARPRQATCYYSSADAAFADRYDAEDRAEDLFDPATPFEGGWRVYSSGPGLILRLLTERVLGLRFRADGVEVDPVLSPDLDGLVARIPTPGEGLAEVTYHVGAAGHGVRRVTIDSADVTGSPLSARYREPGWLLDADAVRPGSRVEVWLG